MGAGQRTKGATYEREVANQLTARFGGKFKRNIDQAREGGFDIPAGPYNVECKRRKTLTTVMGWMKQCIAATKGGRTPIVIAREDNGESIVIMRFTDWMTMAEDAGHLINTKPESLT